MQIYLVRHGQTNLNLEKRVPGRNDISLNENGINQAKEIADKLKSITFDRVYVSPQKRAIETAKIIQDKNIIIDNRLDTYDFGSASGMIKKEIVFEGTAPDSKIYNGVENIKDFTTRINSFINETVSRYKNTNAIILVVGHMDTTGIISACFENFEVVTVYDDYYKFACSVGEYKKYNV